jgi:uncharacterized membrane-anchored protein YitT (DUF2179 family)
MVPEIPLPEKITRDDPHPKRARPRPLLDILQMFVGCGIAGVAFNVLLRPNDIASGGVVGLSLVVQGFSSLEPAFFQWGANFLILFAALKLLGKAFALRSLVGMLMLPLVVYLTRDWAALTDNVVLAALTGGAGLGIGMGIVFRANGSIGGFSTLALLAHKEFNIPVDRTILCLDGLVIFAATLVFRDAEQVLAALICVFLTGRIARSVLSGTGSAKMALIVTEHPNALTQHILSEFTLGVTKLHSQGGYSGNERDTLMVVTRVSEVIRLQRLVRKHDPQAFMIVCDTLEVLGYGFKALR